MPAFDSIPEIWKAVVGYEGIYEVSSVGNVRRILKRTSAKIGKPMSLKVHRDGYSCVELFKNGQAKHKMVHSIVAEAFIGVRPQDRPQVNHKDANKANNCFYNLEYVSAKENSNHAVRFGHWPMGTRHWAAKLNEDAVREIRQSQETQCTLAIRFGVRQGIISAVINRKIWRHVA